MMRYVVTLLPEHPNTNLGKAVRHLKTSLHWSKMFFSTRQVGESTLVSDGEADTDYYDSTVRFFSTYYPHVFFRIEEPTNDGSPVTYLNGHAVSE